MKLTIRSRLTIWFTLTFSAVLFIVLAVLALATDRQLDNEMRAALSTEENWIKTQLMPEFYDLSSTHGSKYDSLAVLLSKKLEERYGLRQQFILLANENHYGEVFLGEEKAYDSLAVELREEMEEGYGLKQQFALIAIEHNDGKAFFSGGVKNVEQLLPNDLLDRSAGSYNITIVDDRFYVRVFRSGWGAAALGVLNETIFEVAERGRHNSNLVSACGIDIRHFWRLAYGKTSAASGGVFGSGTKCALVFPRPSSRRGKKIPKINLVLSADLNFFIQFS